jgi:hypothetical protein
MSQGLNNCVVGQLVRALKYFQHFRMIHVPQRVIKCSGQKCVSFEAHCICSDCSVCVTYRSLFVCIAEIFSCNIESNNYSVSVKV